MFQPNMDRKIEDPLLAKLTPDEIQVLKRCNSEATFNRGVPLGIFGGLSVLWGIKSGYIKSKSTKSTLVIVSVSGFLSFIMGRMTYVIGCVNSSLPKSTFERLNKQLIVTKDYNRNQQLDQKQSTDDEPIEKRHDGISLDIPSINAFESSDNYAPDNSSEPVQARRPFTNTYDDLRQQNRTAFNDDRKPTIRQETTNFFWDEPRRYETLDDRSRRDNYQAPEEAKSKIRRKTKYGDDFE